METVIVILVAAVILLAVAYSRGIRQRNHIANLLLFGPTSPVGPCTNVNRVWHNLPLNYVLVTTGPVATFGMILNHAFGCLLRDTCMYSDPVFRYRNRAKAMRDIRSRTVDPGIRRLLDDVAADYETVAEVLARIEQTQRVIAKRQPFVFSASVGLSASRETSVAPSWTFSRELR